jgi:hypothetical protein
VLGRNDETLWLCGNLLRYFDQAPNYLYVNFDEVKVIDIAKMAAGESNKRLISSYHMETIDKAMLQEQSLEEPLLGKYPSVKWSEYHLIPGE